VVTGVSVAYSLLPLELIEQRNLARRVVSRGGEREIQFLWNDHERLLPIWYDGNLKLVTWGAKRGESRLPCTGWTWQETIEVGKWGRFRPEMVEIPATLLLDGQLWYSVRQCFRGVLVRDEQGRERVYGICEPGSYYYRIMCRGRWMPVLVGERI
jgi:hypothetical protein